MYIGLVWNDICCGQAKLIWRRRLAASVVFDMTYPVLLRNTNFDIRYVMMDIKTSKTFNLKISANVRIPTF